MDYEVVVSQDVPDSWVVEAINYEGDGEIYSALFSGPDAEIRAREYAAWKSHQAVTPLLVATTDRGR